MKNVFLLIVLTLCSGCILASASSNANSITINHPHDGNDYEYGCSGKIITLTNYNTAKNVSYSQLLTFLKKDQTDAREYTDDYCCADFAETLHNNAEKAGIKCGWVGIDFIGGGDGHAINCFDTKDKGRVFIDDTGDSPAQKYDDAIVNLKDGKVYTQKLLFKSDTCDPMGIVKDYEIYW